MSPFMSILTMVLFVISIALFIGILFIGNALIAVANAQKKKDPVKTCGCAHPERCGGKGRSCHHGAKLLTLLFLLPGISLLAQDAQPVTAVASSDNPWSASYIFLYAILLVVLLELIVILVLTRILQRLVNKVAGIEPAAREKKLQAFPARLKAWWWDKLNRSAKQEEEQAVDLGHDYDGIRELDNPIPPWWKLAFYATILFAVIYLWRYHVAGSAPLQLEEYETEMAAAAREHEAYLAKAASEVDENTVTMLDEAGIANGKKVFTASCAACHGQEGEGGVGPNLTDDYWLHGGSLGDIFKTIKYGVPEKGMIAWQDQLSPVQMAELTSFIRSIRGSDPPNPKEPQGELYEQEATPADDKQADDVAE